MSRIHDALKRAEKEKAGLAGAGIKTMPVPNLEVAEAVLKIAPDLRESEPRTERASEGSIREALKRAETRQLRHQSETPAEPMLSSEAAAELRVISEAFPADALGPQQVTNPFEMHGIVRFEELWSLCAIKDW
jgi:hypothetical protein